MTLPLPHASHLRQVTVLDVASSLARGISLHGPGIFKYTAVAFSADDKVRQGVMGRVIACASRI